MTPKTKTKKKKKTIVYIIDAFYEFDHFGYKKKKIYLVRIEIKFYYDYCLTSYLIYMDTNHIFLISKLHALFIFTFTPGGGGGI